MNSNSRGISLACIAVILFAFCAMLPSFFIPYGLPHEGDALNYRIPILKWVLRHATYPNWSWSFVDDYPSLGEILILPFFAIKENLGRIVPMLAYMANGLFAGLIAIELFANVSKVSAHEIFLFVFAGVLGLHPLLLQSNVLMVDDIASCFALGTLYFLIRGNLKNSTIFLGLTLATRYTLWGCLVGALLASLRIHFSAPRRNLQKVFFITLLALLGAAPFMIRNLIVNHNPIFPLLSEWFNGQETFNFGSWGRGKGPIALLLFPYDLLITNTFKVTLFDSNIDYHDFFIFTVGYLFLLQLIAAIVAFGMALQKNVASLRRRILEPKIQATLIFFVAHFFYWWLGSQQLRFFVLELILILIFILYFLYSRLPRPISMLFVLVNLLSIFYVHQESWLVAFGKKEAYYDTAYVRTYRDCLARVNPQKSEVIGHNRADTFLGFFDYDFVFLKPNIYFTSPKDLPHPMPDYIYDDIGLKEIRGYEKWPAEKPCLFKKINS